MINPAPVFLPIFGPLRPTAGPGSPGNGPGSKNSAGFIKKQPRIPNISPVDQFQGYFARFFETRVTALEMVFPGR